LFIFPPSDPQPFKPRDVCLLLFSVLFFYEVVGRPKRKKIKGKPETEIAGYYWCCTTNKVCLEVALVKRRKTNQKKSNTKNVGT